MASAGTSGGSTSSTLQTTSDVPAEQFAGTIGGFAGSYPEWKWLMDLRYAWRDLDVGLAWRYVDSTVDTSRIELQDDRL